MGVSQAQLNRAITQARVRESQGYFSLVKQGDQRAASLFVRLVAYDLNPSGFTSEYGWLSKAPGETQVDGWAEDAICGNADFNDLMNVVDLVTAAGAQPPYTPNNPAPSIGGSVKERRPTNHWRAPQPLNDEEMDYLLSGAEPIPQPPAQYPSYEDLGGDEGGKQITRQLEADYKRAGRPGLDGDCGAWQQRVSYDFLTGRITPVEAAIAAHRAEWCAALGIPVI